MNIQAIRKRIDRNLEKRATKLSDKNRQKKKLKKLVNDLEAAHQARELLQKTAEAVQIEVHSRIAGLVSDCLSSVFDEPYAFTIKFEEKRGKTEAQLVFTRDGHEVDPMTGSGGGVVDVASFALRVACLMLSQPPLRRVLIMDEPFKFVSEEYRENIKSMIEELSEKLDMQIIIVTHIKELEIGKVVNLS